MSIVTLTIIGLGITVSIAHIFYILLLSSSKMSKNDNIAIVLQVVAILFYSTALYVYVT